VEYSHLAQQIMGRFSNWRVLTTANMWQTSQNGGRVSIVGVGISLEVAMLIVHNMAFGIQGASQNFPKGCTGC